MSAGWMSRALASLFVVLLVAACEDERSESGRVDQEPPSIGDEIGFSEIGSTGVTVSWGAGDDGDGTRASALWYKLVRAGALSEIDTLQEAEAITGGAALVQDYTRGLTSKKVSGLSPGVSYAFAVVVRDNTGNKAFYAPALVATVDTSAPEPGGAIEIGEITANSVQLSWGAANDDATPAGQLEYKVVLGANAAEIDTLAEVAAISEAPGLVRDYSAGLLAITVEDLASSRSYAFAALVRDRLGNEALYKPALAATLDITPPTIGNAITFSNITSNRVTVNWGLASDTVTGIAGLKYKVVRAFDAASIDTIDEVEAISSGADLITAYAAAVTRVASTGLASSTSYSFAVLVKDAAGNRALYPPATVTTLDVSAPRVGTAVSASDVTATSLSLSWGAAMDDLSAASALRYKVVKASSAAAIDTLEEVAAISAGPDLLQDFSAGALTRAVSGLSSNTSYAFAVVVRDEANNQAIYAPVTQRTLDNTPPIPGSALSFANVMATSLTVNWGKASDNVSAQAELRYKLVQAASASSIDTLAEADAITTSGAGLVFDYTLDVATHNLSGLGSSTSYAFALIVRDAAGNRALYAPATISTPDVSAPAPGSAITFGTVTASEIPLSWGAASDDVTPAASLSYKVVRADTAAAIDTLGEVTAITSGAQLIADYTVNLTSATASALASSTSYFFAVVVRDASGNEALYTPTQGSTRDVTPPGLGSGFMFFNVTATTIDVDWGAAFDDVTLPAALEYKLVTAPLDTDIDTLAEADAITGAGILQDFTPALTTVPLTGLTPATTYWFAVVVRDAANNRALYTPGSTTTLP